MSVLSKLWRKIGFAPGKPPKSLQDLGWFSEKAPEPIPGFTPADEAKRQILQGDAPTNLFTDRLEFNNEKALIELPDKLKARSVVIQNCPNFQKMPHGLFAEQILVEGCETFSIIPSSMNVAHVRIVRCPSLTDLPDPLHADHVEISECSNLRRLPQRLHVNTLHLPRSRIEQITGKPQVRYELVLDESRYLTEIPSMNLFALSLKGCANLAQLPDELEAHTLDLSGCVRLQWQEFALIEAQFLILCDCVQVTYLPEWLTVTSSIDVANAGLTQIPPWLAGCDLLWRGVEIDERIAFHPEEITCDEIIHERNAERRRVMLERMGWEKFLKGVNHQVLDSDIDPGGERQLLRFELGDDDLRVLAVSCPSTGRRYFIRVPPYVRGCHAAAAWIAGFDNSNEYEPLIET